MSEHAVANADEVYVETQHKIEFASRIILALDPDDLGALVERGERAQSLGPILHPSEWQAGTDNLWEVLTCARALQAARRVIAEVAT